MISHQKAPPTGQPELIAPDIRRLLAPNPSPMTHWGTNTYLIGKTDIAVIDPGPQNSAHLRAILAALTPAQRITHVFVTHAHLDHSPLARPLADATGAKVLAYGNAQAGRSEVMQDLVAGGLTDGGEGVDHDFTPDIYLEDAEVIHGESWSLTALWTPGHMANHMCFDVQGLVFTGDHVMGWASSLVSPPDGDLAAFMASCARLARRQDKAYLPGHGAVVTDPVARIEWLIRHRQEREAAIISKLKREPATVTRLTRQIYTDIPPALLPAANRNVFAHLIDLQTRGQVAANPCLEFGATFTLN